MKRILVVMTLLTTLAGCATNTQYGSCVGVADDKDPKLTYKVSVRNAVIGIMFIETIFVPVIVLVNETFCPVGRK